MSKQLSEVERREALMALAKRGMDGELGDVLHEVHDQIGVDMSAGLMDTDVGRADSVGNVAAIIEQNGVRGLTDSIPHTTETLACMRTAHGMHHGLPPNCIACQKAVVLQPDERPKESVEFLLTGLCLSCRIQHKLM